MNKSALVRLRALPDAELEKIAAMVRDCDQCGKPFFASRAGARHCSPLCRLHSHRNHKAKPKRSAAERKQ